MPRNNFNSPKDVQAIEQRVNAKITICAVDQAVTAKKYHAFSRNSYILFQVFFFCLISLSEKTSDQPAFQNNLRIAKYQRNSMNTKY